MSTRYFQLIDPENNHRKFCQIKVAAVSPHEATCSWGRIGTAGQAKTFTFSDPVRCLSFQRRKIAEKLSEGYVEKATRRNTRATPDPDAHTPFPGCPDTLPDDDENDPFRSPPPAGAPPAPDDMSMFDLDE